MRRALLKSVIMLMMAAPWLAAQTPPAPPKPPKPVKPAQVQMYGMDMASSGSYLGIEPRDISPDRASQLKLKRPEGVEVTMVDQDSPAGKAGLKEHDVILTFNGSTVESVEQLKRMLRETPAGRQVALGISRDGQLQTLNVTLGDRQKMFAAHGFPNFTIPDVHIPPIEMPEMPSFMVIQSMGRNGTWVEDLSPQLGEFLGVKGGHGVLVRSVDKGSAGEAAGLRAGDVIVRISNEPVSDVGDWRRLLRSKAGQTVELSVVRDKREQTLSLAVPAQRRARSSSGGGMAFLGPEMDELRDELDYLRPEIAEANQKATIELQREMRLHQKDFEKAQKDAAAEIQREMRRHQQDMEKLRKEMEQLHHELRFEFED